MPKHLLSKSALYASFFVLPFSMAKLHACTGHDIVFTHITFVSISPTEYTYSYQIKNIGTAGIALNEIVIQNYVSTDSAQGNDGAAGGTFIDINSKEVLAAGGVYNGTMGVYPFPQNTHDSHPYLVTEVYLNTETECDLSNNLYIGLIEMVPTGWQAPSIAQAAVNWNRESKSFSVDNWSTKTSSLHYTLIHLSGAIVCSGTAQQGQSTSLDVLKEGVYLLHLSDGEKTYLKRILY